MSNTNNKGKGGNFETKRNPFLDRPRGIHTRPSFDQSSDLTTAVELLVKSGCAVMFGATRDDGAVVFTILDGDNRHRTYCSNDEEFHEAIESICRTYSAA